MALVSAESDKEVYFGPYSTAVDMHKYAVDNYDSVISIANVTNGFLMELAANCLKFVDCVYVLARLVKEDILENDRKKLNSIVSKVRMMYNQGKSVIKKSQSKQNAFKEFLDKPFQIPSGKKPNTPPYSTPSSSRSNTPSIQAGTSTEQNSVSGSQRRDSIASSFGSIEEGNCWDPNADEQGNDLYFMQQEDDDGPTAGTWDLQQHLAKVQGSILVHIL